MSFIEKLQKGMQIEPIEKKQIGSNDIENHDLSNEENYEDGTAVFVSYKNIEEQEKTNTDESVPLSEEPTNKKTKMRGRPRKMIGSENIEKTNERTSLDPVPEVALETKGDLKKTFSKTMVNKKTSNAENQNENNWLNGDGQLTVNVFQTEDELVLQSAIAGVKVEELDVIIEDDVITIKGNRPNPLAETGDYFIEECYWGPFSRKVILPVEVDSSRADATMKEGILTIRIPKIQREKKKKLMIKE